MVMKVEVLSGPKGSNPGGICTIFGSRDFRLDAYFKYCVGSQLPKSSPFSPETQPVLEVLASKIANNLGLQTPNCFVLDNRSKNVDFIYGPKDHSNKQFYFVSKLETNPSGEVIDKRLEELVERERVYLDSLLFGDYHSRQNLTYSRGRSVYIDLGCWRFVCANDGLLKNKLHGMDTLLEKEYKKAISRLESINLINAEGDIVNLAGIIISIPYIQIPLLNSSTKQEPLNRLLSKEECSTIQNFLAQGLDRKRKEFNERELLVKG